MNNIIDNINQILSEWDPIGVGGDTASDEYRRYIPQLFKHIKNREELVDLLESILIRDLETGYNRSNIDHKKDLDEIVGKLMQLV